MLCASRSISLSSARLVPRPCMVATIVALLLGQRGRTSYASEACGRRGTTPRRMDGWMDGLAVRQLPGDGGRAVPFDQSASRLDPGPPRRKVPYKGEGAAMMIFALLAGKGRRGREPDCPPGAWCNLELGWRGAPLLTRSWARSRDQAPVADGEGVCNGARFPRVVRVVDGNEDVRGQLGHSDDGHVGEQRLSDLCVCAGP